MKKFNKTTQIEISVDSIADMFLGSQAFLFENREAFIETVVGTCLDKGTLGIVLAGFMGIVPKCKLEIDTVVYCTKKVYDYSTEESRTNQDTVIREIGEATITEHNPYAKECYKIVHARYKIDGSIYWADQWVTAESVEGQTPMSHQL